MKQPYELDWPRNSGKHNIDLVGILTGLPVEEIIEAAPKGTLWRGPSFTCLFRDLGFNTSQGFVPFDPDTEHPCLMRTTSFRKNEWYAWAYFDRKVYAPTDSFTFDAWLRYYKRLKITSMLQVWI